MSGLGIVCEEILQFNLDELEGASWTIWRPLLRRKWQRRVALIFD
jgi:hypothetical protein